MAVLSPYSSKFTNVLDEVQSKIAAGELGSLNERKDFIKSKGLDPDEFKKTAIEYDKLMEEDPDELRRPGFGIGRAAGRFAGSLGEGIANISGAVAPEFTKKVGEKYRDIVPESIQKDLQATFKPTDTGFGTIGEIGGFIAGGGAGIKLLGAVAKGAKLKKLDTATRAGKIGKAAKIGTGFAIGTTAIEKPEDNFVNFLADYVNEDVSDEQGKKIGTFGSILERLKVNPNDSVAQKYARAFANNLLVEGGFAAAFPIVGGLLKAGANTEVAKFLTKGVKEASAYVGESVPLKGIKEKIKRYGTSRMGLNDKALSLLVEREGATKAAITRAEELSIALKQTAKKEGLKTTDDNLKGLNDALGGDLGALESIRIQFPETAKVLEKMRGEIKTLSKDVGENIAGGGLKTTIGRNLDTYLNRTYRIFDDPNYSLKNIPEKDRENAIRYFRETLKIDEKDIPQVLKAYTDGMKKGEFNSFLKGVGPRTSQILKQRKDIPVEIRNLWGEVKDPFVNYVNSFTKLANLKSEYKFRKEIAEEALKQGDTVATRDPLKGVGRGQVGKTPEGEDVAFQQVERLGLGGVRNNIDDPLEGLFLNDAWKKGIEEGTEVFIGEGSWLKSWMKIKATSQAMKTVFSIPTHGRNILGNLFIMTANGTVNPSQFGKAFKDTSRRLLNINTKEGRERLARYQELGVVDSAIDARQLRKSAQEGFNLGPNGFAQKTAAGRGVKKGVEKTTQLYEAEDNLFKIANFENLLKNYRKAFPDMPKEQLERFVAQRTRDMMPNYNLVPKAIKSLRAFPVGNFVAFPAEMVRNSYNLAKYAWKDISGRTAKELGITDPEAIKQLRNIGYKRLAGMTTAAIAGDAAVNQSKEIFGISDEQEAMFQKTLAPWEQGTNKIFLSPLQRNKKGDIEVEYMNLGPIDPYAYIKNPVKMVINAAINNEDYNETELNDMYTKAIQDVVAPFTNPSMAFASALEAYRGKGAVADESALAPITRVLLSTFTPGTVDFFVKRQKFLESREARGEGQEVNQYGFGINPGEVDFPAFFGIKRQKANLSDSFSFATNKPIGDMRRAKSRFTNKIRDYSVTNPDEIYDAYKESQQNKLKHAQRLRGLVKAYRTLGMDEADMYTSLTKDGLLEGREDEFKDIIFADQNIFMADEIPEQSILLGEVETGKKIPYDRIYELYSNLTGKEID
jgi:hypothetical protein